MFLRLMTNDSCLVGLHEREDGLILLLAGIGRIIYLLGAYRYLLLYWYNLCELLCILAFTTFGHIYEFWPCCPESNQETARVILR